MPLFTFLYSRYLGTNSFKVGNEEGFRDLLESTVDSRTKSILAKVYASQFVEEISQVEYLIAALGIDEGHLASELSELEKRDLVKKTNSISALTPMGRKAIVAVMTGGAFDILHPGHIETLEQARALGDVLVVSVARDSTFEKNKNRKPHHNEMMRRKLVSAVRPVDACVLGSEVDIFETVLRLKPDIIALGYDQFHNEEKILSEVKSRGLDVKVVRLKSSVPDIKSSKLITQSESLREI
jgi:cytidyltransferase-like protein